MVHALTRTLLAIEGMRNDACRERIIARLAQKKGVRSVTVSLIRSRAVVVHDRTVEATALLAEVRRAGFRATQL